MSRSLPGTFPAVVRQLIDASPGDYSALVVTGPTPAPTVALLGHVTAEQLEASPGVCSTYAAAMLCGLWLWNNGLSECHEIAQKSPEYFEESAKDRLARARKLSLDSIDLARGAAGVPDPLARKTDARDAAATLAFWHAIMHRREGDFSNSKYWYARAAGHPALATMAAQVPVLVNQAPASKQLMRMTMHGWDPGAWVDFVESVHDRPEDSRYAAAAQLQRLEWRVLFEHCARG